MKGPGLEGLTWAVSGKTIASASVLVSGACAVLLLSPEQVGTFLLVINLLSLFAVADFGSTGYLTVRSAGVANGTSGVQVVAQLTNTASVGLFAIAIGAIGTILLREQPPGTEVLTPLSWAYVLVCYAAWHTVSPFLSQLDGMGSHARAWSLLFLFEFLAGLGLTVPLLFANATGALVLTATARLGMVPLVLLALPSRFRPWNSWRPGALRRTSAWSGWVETALRVQASFLWVNLTGFAAIRTILPFVYFYQGARGSAAVGVSFSVATAMYNLCSSWSFGSMGRLAIAYTVRDAPRFFGILRTIRARSAAAFALLLSGSLLAFYVVHRVGVPLFEEKVPELAVYLPVGVGHFLMLAASWDAVAIRATGRDLSAPVIGGIGLCSIGVFWFAASRSRIEWVSWTFAVANFVSTLVFAHYWSLRRKELAGLGLERSGTVRRRRPGPRRR